MKEVFIVLSVVLGVLGAITYVWITNKFNSLREDLKERVDYRISMIPNQRIYTNAVIDLYSKVLEPIDEQVEWLSDMFGNKYYYKLVTKRSYSVGDIFLDSLTSVYKVKSIISLDNCEGEYSVTYEVVKL